ncbi:hypothetical protein [Novosphingobium terrae]|uniref:hypothetical protein n=1 Tax=Novosphingobium terrae TaxID=2726189 RepID=UPI00197F74C8|nr:hypothetical protein [Novosphingobium terrae]
MAKKTTGAGSKQKLLKRDTAGSVRKRVATTRSTAGPGFDFEDQVAAWALLWMLSGETLPALEGKGLQIQSQVGALGWAIDDLLVTTTCAGKERSLAISCKSNMQVSRNGFPPDFAGLILKQWREQTGPFDRETDQLALATRGSNAQFETAWADIKLWCEGRDLALVLRRINASGKHQRVFDSLRNAPDHATASEEEAVEIIRHLHILPFDFQLAQSKDASHAINQCRHLLANRDRAEALTLWRAIIGAARDTRLGSGTLLLSDLWHQLRSSYALQAHPDYAASWTTLENLTCDYRADIQTTLPTGYRVDRSERYAELERVLKQAHVAVVLADSGVGKSALVKQALDDRFPDWHQVWLGPEELNTALSAAKRSLLPLSHPLPEILNATGHPRNVLVLDSAERFTAADLPAAKQLIDLLVPRDAGTASSWSIVLTSQPQSWSATCRQLFGQTPPEALPLDPLDNQQVREAICSNPSLRWLVAYDQTVAALSNLRTLFWFMSAADTLGSNTDAPASHAAVADHLWHFWTAGRIDLQGVMMRLAKREASFERSFAISQLEGADATILQSRPSQLPLTVRHNRIAFEHDLAADWARFQYLKEISEDVPAWAAYASNPLWAGALRMLGQHLLREPRGEETAWDQAFRLVWEGKPPLALDVLLDALCLDPEAEHLLEERAEFLLANRGQWLNKFLRRFQHVATVPSQAPAFFGATVPGGLFFDANYRTVVAGLWPGVAMFLARHEDRVADLMLPSVSDVCATWLNGVPTHIGSIATPFRRDFAQLALRTARVVQADRASGTIHIGEDPPFFSAALAGAPDLPDEVAQWALEMAGRRDISDFVSDRVIEVRRRKAEEREERMRTDPVYRAGQERRHAARAPMSISMRRSRPAWPLGPQRRVDHDFEALNFKSEALWPLMRVNPAAAAEVITALHLDDNPHEDRNSALQLEPELGFSYQRDAYPTAFWKSPFFSFLEISPDGALGALIDLVNFAVERWVAGPRHDPDFPRAGIELSAGNTTITYRGDGGMFRWGQTNSMHNGTLFSALDALERWLTVRLTNGRDCTAYIERLLREGRSTAVLGVLVNVAKFEPKLLSGALAPVLSNPTIYMWDDYRVRVIDENFIGWNWAKFGDAVFELAKGWAFAAHRKLTLNDVAVARLKADPAFASDLKGSTSAWEIPDVPARALDLSILQASLDRDNYRLSEPTTDGEAELVFECPEILLQEYERQSTDDDTDRGAAILPYKCRSSIENGVKFDDQSATTLANHLANVQAGTGLDESIKARNVIALSSVLICCCYQWISRQAEAFRQVCDVVKEAALSLPDDANGVRRYRIGTFDEDMVLWGSAIMQLWLHDEENLDIWEPLVVRFLSSGEDRAIRIVRDAAFQHRSSLGDAWWRLMQVGLFWSALIMLAPREADDGIGAAVWNQWLARFRRMKIRGVPASAHAIKVSRVIEGYERLEADGWRKAVASKETSRRYRAPEDRVSAGVERHFLNTLFQWLLDREHPLGPNEVATEFRLCLDLWGAEVREMKSRRNEKGEYPLPSDLGYSLLSKFASLLLVGPVEKAPDLWEAVFALGNDAHVAVEQFINAFMRLAGTCDDQRFRSVWRDMIVFALAQGWHERDRWFYGEGYLRLLLGFGNGSLAKLQERLQTLEGLKDVYKLWAEIHLSLEEDNLAGFADFLRGEFAASLRLEGIVWIAAAVAKAPLLSRFYRERAGPALIDLLDTTINENGAELQQNQTVRDAVISIAAELAGKSFRNALALQDRIKLIR